MAQNKKECLILCTYICLRIFFHKNKFLCYKRNLTAQFICSVLINYRTVVSHCRSAFYMVYNDFEKEQHMIVDGQEEKSICSGDRLKRAVGM